MVTRELLIPLGEFEPWDEFATATQTLTVRLTTPHGADLRRSRFGVREFAVQGTQFTINGRPTFLRGKHDGCVFPLTGHPPMEVEGWLRYFRGLRV